MATVATSVMPVVVVCWFMEPPLLVVHRLRAYRVAGLAPRRRQPPQTGGEWPGTMAILDIVERLRAWSHRRQRLDGSAPDLLSALHDVVAVYSAHPSGPLALHARTSGLTAGAFADLESRRQAIRIVAMRGSAFLVPAATAD